MGLHQAVASPFSLLMAEDKHRRERGEGKTTKTTKEIFDKPTKPALSA